MGLDTLNSNLDFGRKDKTSLYDECFLYTPYNSSLKTKYLECSTFSGSFCPIFDIYFFFTCNAITVFPVSPYFPFEEFDNI